MLSKKDSCNDYALISSRNQKADAIQYGLHQLYFSRMCSLKIG